jgi:Fic family protein
VDYLCRVADTRTAKGTLAVKYGNPRLILRGPSRISASNYITTTGASPATATRDLADLVDKRALDRVGERRHARYHIAIPLRPVVSVMLEDRGKLV